MTRNEPIRRRLALAGLGASGLSLLALRPAVAQDQQKEQANGYIPLADLNLSDPIVDIGGPFPTILRGASVGELIQVQIRYPVSPPFPKAARFVNASPNLHPVGVHTTGGQIAVLTPKPQSGAIGVAFLSAFVQATGEGNGNFTVEIRLADGSRKAVPFAFRVGPAK